MKLALLSLLLVLAARAQVVSTIYVAAPQVRLTCGDSAQLTAVARDGAGNVVSSANFNWTSSNSAVISVDSNGVVKANGLGLADITASASGRSGVLRLQSLPQRIDVTPVDSTIVYGNQQQYSAVAYDLNGQPIPSATFAWHVMVGSGATDSTTVPITPDGIVNARTLGYYIVRASIVYPNTPDQFEREFDGSTSLTIMSGDYKITALASSDTVFTQTRLRGKTSRMAINDAGQLAFSSSFDGVNSGVLNWQNSGLNVLAVAGTAGVIPGTVYYDFDNLSTDSKGNVVATAAVDGSNSVIVMMNASGVNLLIPDRAAADAVLDVTAMSTNSQSLSETGDIALRGNFHYPNDTVNYTGLLRYSHGALILEASSRDALPGLTGTVSFDGNYGIDNQGVIYFAANGGSGGRVIYRKAILQDPAKVLAVNDTLNGLKITSLPSFIVGVGGDLVVQVNLSDGSQALLRYAGGFSGQTPVIMSVLPGYINQIYWASAQGGIVWNGDAGLGYGIYYWSGDNSRPRSLVTQYAPSPSGEPVADFYHAVVDGNGNVYASLRGVDTSWMLAQLTGTPSIIAASGTPVPVPANLDLNGNNVNGDRTGPLHVYAGGNPTSILQVDSHGVLPTLVLGDRLPGGATYLGAGTAKSASGDLYVTQGNGTFRLSNSGASILASYPVQMSDGVTVNGAFNLSANDHGQALVVGNTNQSHQRLLLMDKNSMRSIAYFNGAPPYQTPSPGGGVFSSLGNFALNEAGQALINAGVNGGPGGLFFYDGTAWQAVCLLNACKFDGETVTGIGALRAANNRLCAQLSTSAGNQRLDCWENGAWTNLLKRGDVTSDGTEITFVNNNFDINRRGDVAAILNTSIGAPEVFLKTAGGYATVVTALFPPVPGADFISGVFSVDLRDDRRVFFVIQEFSGRMVAYEADPLF